MMDLRRIPLNTQNVEKKTSYPPNRKGPLAGRVAAQRITSPETLPEAIATSTSALKGVPSTSTYSEPKLPGSSSTVTLTGVRSTPKIKSTRSQPIEEPSSDPATPLQVGNG